jgi:hypothetical protein
MHSKSSKILTALELFLVIPLASGSVIHQRHLRRNPEQFSAARVAGDTGIRHRYTIEPASKDDCEAALEDILIANMGDVEIPTEEGACQTCEYYYYFYTAESLGS